MAFESRLPEFEDRMRLAVDRALLAQGYLYANAVKQRLRGGCTSGAFVTGAAASSVTVGQPIDGPDGREVEVGTPLDYPLYWELGHNNTYTRRYERVEIWGPTLDEMASELAAVFEATLKDEIGDDFA